MGVGLARLAGKTIWVTAAAAGIGRACAALFAAEGARVFATDVDSAGLSTLKGVQKSVLDATDAGAVTAFAAGLPPIDAAVHCVGWVHHGTVLDCELEDWRRSFTVNVESFYHLARTVLPAMIQANSGSIQCIASVASSLKGLPNRAAYGASKAALLGLVKSIAADWVASGIRVNAVCPGTVESPSLLQRVEAAGRAGNGTAEAMARFVERQPMGRLGTPEEVALLCLYLASDESRFVTGQFFAVDGGMLI